MRRPTPSSASGSTVGYYAIILILVCACLWVMSSSPESLTKDSNSKVLELVLEENARLNSAVAACTKADAAPAPKLRAGQECDCSAKTTELELEVEDLRAQLRKANAVCASPPPSPCPCFLHSLAPLVLLF